MFKGFAPDPVAAMAAVDAVAMPSRWEAYGLVAIEALAARRPLLVNDIDGLSDHIACGAHKVSQVDIRTWQQAIETLTTAPAATDRPVAAASSQPEAIFNAAWTALLTRTLARG